MDWKQSYVGPVWLDLDQIDPQPALELRKGLDEEAVNEYVEEFGKLPPMYVVFDREHGDRHWTTDGGHRYTAAKRKGIKQVACMVRMGTWLDAMLDAALANVARGVRDRPDDKRRRVEVFLLDPKIGRHPTAPWSHHRIAEACGVDHSTVSRIATELSTATVASQQLQNSEPKPKSIGRDGRARSQDGRTRGAEAGGGRSGLARAS